MKAIWKGTISFGLVSIPVALYSATGDRGVSFKTLHAACKTPLRYRRWCDAHGKEVAWKDVAKGMEIAEDTYFVLSHEELERLRPEKTKSISISGFISRSQVDDIYFGKAYFAGPQNAKDKAFFLFRDALSDSAGMAFGSFVMHEKEHLCIIRSYRNGLLLTTLKYPEEVRDISKVDFLDAKIRVTDAELKLAHELIGKLGAMDFSILDYHETFSEELKELVRRKASGGRIPVHKARKQVSLIKALKASIK